MNRAKSIASFAADKKAEDIVVIDIRKVSSIADYFVICSASSERKMRAIADGIAEGLGETGYSPHHIEGYRDSAWILIDCGSVVAHIFYAPKRRFYNLEGFWGDAPRLRLN